MMQQERKTKQRESERKERDCEGKMEEEIRNDATYNVESELQLMIRTDAGPERSRRVTRV